MELHEGQTLYATIPFKGKLVWSFCKIHSFCGDSIMVKVENCPNHLLAIKKEHIISRRPHEE